MTKTGGNDALERMEAAIDAIHNSDDFKRFLKVAAAFHRYSFGNQLLIAAQMPDATRVAGYRTWRKLGRQVRKGEHGITIIVPHTYKGTRLVDDEGNEQPGKPRVYFGSGHVFDVSQTDGEPLPQIYQHTAGETQAALFERARSFANSRGIGIDIDASGQSTGANGYFDPRARRIWIDEALDTDGRTSTLLHELAHALDPHTGEAGDYQQHRGERETVAEAASYVVAEHFGFDVSAESFAYVAIWSTGDKAVFKRALTDIQKISAEMIDALDPMSKASTEGEG